MVYSQTFPELFSFVRNQHITISSAASNTHLYELFHLPLSPEAFEQYVTLSECLQSLQLQDIPDLWMYSWGSTIFPLAEPTGS
jgi:hypothetical protein